jgi:hypothetical protein
MQLQALIFRVLEELSRPLAISGFIFFAAQLAAAEP